MLEVRFDTIFNMWGAKRFKEIGLIGIVEFGSCHFKNIGMNLAALYVCPLFRRSSKRQFDTHLDIFQSGMIWFDFMRAHRFIYLFVCFLKQQFPDSNQSR